MTPPALEIDSLTKDFPSGRAGWKIRAVDHLGLTLPAGSVCGLLGPNGSGKSTTIRILLGLSEPTAGTVRVLGGTPAEAVRQGWMGYLPEGPFFQKFLTARELVTQHARLCGFPAKDSAERAAATLARCGLADAADRRVGTYSKGMLQRLGLAQAIVHQPKLVILDEPTAGLDPAGVEEVGKLIGELRAEGRTVVLCSHVLSQVEALCDHLAILYRGKLVASGPTATLLTEPGHAQVRIGGWKPENEAALAAWLSARGASLEAVSPARERLERFYLRALGNKDL